MTFTLLLGYGCAPALSRLRPRHNNPITHSHAMPLPSLTCDAWYPIEALTSSNEVLRDPLSVHDQHASHVCQGPAVASWLSSSPSIASEDASVTQRPTTRSVQRRQRWHTSGSTWINPALALRPRMRFGSLSR